MVRLVILSLCAAAFAACSSSSGSADVACQHGSNFCETFKDSTTNDTAGYETECTDGMGKVVSSCPTTSLVGCCTVNEGSRVTDETCFYTSAGETAANLETACEQGSGTVVGLSNAKGTWSTTP